MPRGGTGPGSRSLCLSQKDQEEGVTGRAIGYRSVGSSGLEGTAMELVLQVSPSQSS